MQSFLKCNYNVYDFVCVCSLDVSELVDEVTSLSDSTSEEQSLSSYTSESFDDNGKTLMLKLPNEL